MGKYLKNQKSKVECKMVVKIQRIRRLLLPSGLDFVIAFSPPMSKVKNIHEL